jgi:hypothetical protein
LATLGSCSEFPKVSQERGRSAAAWLAKIKLTRCT